MINTIATPCNLVQEKNMLKEDSAICDVQAMWGLAKLHVLHMQV